MLKRTGAWIFVSHSLQDFKQVRLVRNALEERGHFPLLFYLRCLHDDSEVESLIRREIDARNFFLICDSPHARASRWVQDEVRVIDSRPRRLVARLDLGSPWDRQLEVIERVAARVNVFVSFARSDAPVADSLYKELEAADYSLLGRAEDLHPGDVWKERLLTDLDEAISTGFVLVLLSPEAVARKESFQWLEVRHALDRQLHSPPGNTRVIPVILGDYSTTISRLPPMLQTIQALDLSSVPATRQPSHIVAALDKLVSSADA